MINLAGAQNQKLADGFLALLANNWLVKQTLDHSQKILAAKKAALAHLVTAQCLKMDHGLKTLSTNHDAQQQKLRNLARSFINFYPRALSNALTQLISNNESQKALSLNLTRSNLKKKSLLTKLTTAHLSKTHLTYLKLANNYYLIKPSIKNLLLKLITTQTSLQALALNSFLDNSQASSRQEEQEFIRVKLALIKFKNSQQVKVA